MTVTSSNFAAYGGWNSRQRLYSPEARWNTSGDYADNILEMTGRPRTPTDGVGELHSLLALVRRLQISQRRDQAEQQITRLEGMKGQPIGWDGRQAAAPDEATIELASALLRRFAEAGLPIPTATMSPSGNAALFAP